MKETDVKSLLSLLPPIVHHLDDEERSSLEDKINALQEQWMTLRSQLDKRIDLARTYVKFHTVAVDMAVLFDALEDEMKKPNSSSDEIVRLAEEKWLSIQQLYIQLSHIGKNFTADAEKVREYFLNYVLSLSYSLKDKIR